MKYHFKKTIFLMAACCLTTPGYATNYDDGITSDELIEDNISKDTNIQFIIQKAMARSQSGNNKVISSDNNAGIGNVIVGPGTDLTGAIIINQSENEGGAVISK